MNKEMRKAAVPGRYRCFIAGNPGGIVCQMMRLDSLTGDYSTQRLALPYFSSIGSLNQRPFITLPMT